MDQELIEQVKAFVAMFGEFDSSDAEFTHHEAGFLRLVLTERASELPEELLVSLRKIVSDRQIRFYPPR